VPLPMKRDWGSNAPNWFGRPQQAGDVALTLQSLDPEADSCVYLDKDDGLQNAIADKLMAFQAAALVAAMSTRSSPAHAPCRSLPAKRERGSR
jgi:hypothetical protein